MPHWYRPEVPSCGPAEQDDTKTLTEIYTAFRCTDEVCDLSSDPPLSILTSKERDQKMY